MTPAFGADLRDALRAALPHADLDAATPLGEGWGATAYRLPDAGGDWAVRVPKAGSPWARDDLERELGLLRALEAHGLPTPREARGVYDDDARLVAAIHRVVEGVEAGRAHTRGAAGDRLAGDLGRFFTGLHGFPRGRALALGVRDVDLWQHTYEPLVEACLPRLAPRSREWLEARARRFLAEGGSTRAPRVLLHGDIFGEHIRVDGDGRLAGVIDFADSLFADPALDFAGLLNDFSWAFMERVLRHYEGEVDPDMRRRARFYIDVAPLFGVRWASEAGFLEIERADRRKFAARAAAATRRGISAHS